MSNYKTDNYKKVNQTTDCIKAIRSASGDKKIDFESLANRPDMSQFAKVTDSGTGDGGSFVSANATPTILMLETNSSNREADLRQFVGATKIDWGDGTIVQVTNEDNLIHTYTNNSGYIVKIYGCTEISERTINYKLPIDALSIGNSVSKIGDNAFAMCSNLEFVTIPDSVMSIGSCAFGLCDNLISVILGNNVQIFRNGIFEECRKLTNIEFKNHFPFNEGYLFGVSGATGLPKEPPTQLKVIIPFACGERYKIEFSEVADKIFERQAFMYRHNISLGSMSNDIDNLQAHLTIISSKEEKYTAEELLSFISENGVEYPASGWARLSESIGLVYCIRASSGLFSAHCIANNSEWENKAFANVNVTDTVVMIQ
jgi:hypothetical protein